MATISQGNLATIAGESQRLVDVAKNLVALTSQVQDTKVSQQLQNQIEAVLGAAERIGTALSGVR
jgi:hypothetical protein